MDGRMGEGAKAEGGDGEGREGNKGSRQKREQPLHELGLGGVAGQRVEHVARERAPPVPHLRPRFRARVREPVRERAAAALVGGELARDERPAAARVRDDRPVEGEPLATAPAAAAATQGPGPRGRQEEHVESRVRAVAVRSEEGVHLGLQRHAWGLGLKEGGGEVSAGRGILPEGFRDVRPVSRRLERGNGLSTVLHRWGL